MLRRSIEAAAEELDLARDKLGSLVPQGYELVKESVICDGLPQTITASEDSLEHAFDRADETIPTDSSILQKRVINNATQYLKERCPAFSEDEAETNLIAIAAREGVVGPIASRRIELVKRGKPGMLGIGKRPNTYDVEINFAATVELTYKPKARIRGIVFPRKREYADALAFLRSTVEQARLYDKTTSLSHQAEVENLLRGGASRDWRYGDIESAWILTCFLGVHFLIRGYRNLGLISIGAKERYFAMGKGFEWFDVWRTYNYREEASWIAEVTPRIEAFSDDRITALAKNFGLSLVDLSTVTDKKEFASAVLNREPEDILIIDERQGTFCLSQVDHHLAAAGGWVAVRSNRVGISDPFYRLSIV